MAQLWVFVQETGIKHGGREAQNYILRRPPQVPQRKTGQEITDRDSYPLWGLYT